MADVLDLTMRAVAYPVCWTILVNGVDDLFIDMNYILRGIFKVGRRRMTVPDLKSVEQKRIAMLVPAWHEAAVIQQMLELNLRQLDYDADNYDIFVGTYQNDPETQEKVDLVSRIAKNVHKVVVPHAGPTSKADCLNWVYQSIQLVEERRGQRFDILLMHDAEDIIHPLALRLYNYLIPEYDFVQTPVFPLELPWYAFVGSTYKDEFTEHHLKDMLVREEVGGLVPSAGVGSGFDRDAFEEIALANRHQAFNVESLTEDYEIGLKFKLAGKKSYFAVRAIERTTEEEKRAFLIGPKRKVRVTRDEYIATREYFPDQLQFAVRQRSRWVLGISLQTWEQLGWQGGPAVLYTLWRDRKALITNFVAVFAYVVALYCVVRLGLGYVTGRAWTFDNLLAPGSILWWLVMANTLILAWRAAMKYITVDKIYGPVHGLLSIPRFFVSNLINFMATTKAVRQYAHHRITGEPLRWLKTDHVFPDVDVLRTYQRKLGELLQDREGLTEDELYEALDLQTKTGLKLGEVMSLTGIVSSRKIAGALGEQHSLPVVEIDPFTIPAKLLRALPESDAELMGVLPLGYEDGETITVATAAPPDVGVKERLEGLLRSRVAFSFADGPALLRARQRAYRRLVVDELAPPRTERLGERLIAGGFLNQEQLDAAVDEQRDSGERLGEILVRRGDVAAQIVSEALANRNDLPFRAIDPADADSAALTELGYGLCALYGFVPMKAESGTAQPIACCSPLHEEVRLVLAARLGRELEFMLCPSLDVRCALALSSRLAFPQGIAAGTGGMDGVELSIISNDPGWSGDVVALRNASLDAGRSPIEYLLASGRISPQLGARLRARSLSVALAQPSELDPDADYEWLPPGWALRDDIQLLDRSKGAIVVAAPRPTPRLARELAALFPDLAVAWRVAPYSRVLEEEAAPEIRTGSHTSVPAAGGV